jgi:hypothetical protein
MTLVQISAPIENHQHKMRGNHMVYQVVWDDAEQRIVREVYIGDVTVDDYYRCSSDTLQLIAEQSHPVDVILDLTQTRNIDMTGFLGAVRAMDKKTPDNQRLVLVVQANLFIQTMGKIATTIARRATANLHFVKTLDDAYAIIAEHNAQAGAGAAGQD